MRDSSLRPRTPRDPFVRLHRIDENAAVEVAPLLGFLRRLERAYECAVLLVRHVRKGSAHLRAGQALRGSSELHAWGDSNLYLRRLRDRLSIEHRASASGEDLSLAFPTAGCPLALAIVDTEHPPIDLSPTASLPTPAQRVYQAIAAAAEPLALTELRQSCRIRTQTLCAILVALCADGAIRKSAGGYTAAR